ncbi:ABC transporter substrate-binding protein [Leucobacter sp. CX42]|uniref:siderophore ABC transporter substrate-binding protein n=1 Tax=unclassified Leucobacter TaxID=2621730 RepID=UPI00333FBA65
MNRRMTRSASVVALALTAALTMAGCSSADTDSKTEDAAASTVTITDNHGEIEVPVNPERVVVLDNHAFETLTEWDVPLVAAPKDVMGTVWPNYTDDESVANVGNHREPDLEAIIAASPDLIIGGYRFGDYYDDLVKQNPDAKVIELAPRDGEDVFSELKRESTILGQIFDHEAEATALNDDLDAAIAGAKEAYDGKSTVMAVNTSAGKIGYLAPGVGRSLGPIFGALDLKPALEVEGASDDHKGDDISVEAIAASNPDWIVALDRDAAFAADEREEGSLPATELITNSEALKNVTAVTEGNVVVLDSNFYLTEDIQAYTDLFNQLKAAFAG